MDSNYVAEIQATCIPNMCAALDTVYATCYYAIALTTIWLSSKLSPENTPKIALSHTHTRLLLKNEVCRKDVFFLPHPVYQLNTLGEVSVLATDGEWCSVAAKRFGFRGLESRRQYHVKRHLEVGSSSSSSSSKTTTTTASTRTHTFRL